MARRARLVVPAAVVFLVSCSGSVDPARAAPCAQEVCGAPGAPLTLQLTWFDHASDVLAGDVGASAVSLRVSPSTTPLPAEPCPAGSPLAELITQWNTTGPVDPYGQFDLFDYDGDYHRLLAKLARAGAAADLTLDDDMTTVATLRPVCTPGS